MKQRWINNIGILVILIFAFGCATTGAEKKDVKGANPVLSSIEIKDNQLNIVVDKPFTYTIYKSSDPYKVIVELPDVRLGVAPAKMRSDKAGITEIVPSQLENPMSVRLEILLSSPVAVEPLYKDNALTVKIKEEPEVKGAETAEEVPKAEEKIQEVASPAGKKEEPVKEVKWDEVTTPEQKPVAPAADVKETPAVSKPEQKTEALIAAPQKPEPKTEAVKEFPPATAIVQVNIEKGQDALKIRIRGDGALSPNVFRLDNRAVLDMPKVEMKALLPSAVPMPLKSIRAGKHMDKTRLVLDMKEGTNFDVAAVEDSVIISLRIPEKEKPAVVIEKAVEAAPKTAVAAEENPAEGRYKGQKISLDFQDADIGPIFRLLADISGYNFVIDPTVRGKITMKLMNVPWDQALDIILQTFNFGKRIEGNIIWIAPTSMFAKMAEDKTKAKDVEEKLEDLTQEIVRINYATASDISGAISQAKLLSSRGSVTMDSRMNTLIIKDTQKSIDKIKELVKIMDVAKPQVMIEAKIVEVSSNYSETLGIRWGGSFAGTGINTFGNEVSGSFSVNTPIVSPGSSATNPGGALGMAIGTASSIQVNLSLSALESINKSKKLANPKILTMDNESATIQQGTSIPVQTTSAEGTKTEFVNATLNLTVTPRVTPEGYIQLKINAANDSLGILTPQGYSIEKKSVQTQALVKNGDTLVIGGIYTTSRVEAEEGLPLLSRIPILGWLFKTQTQSGPNITELLVFITPTIISKP